MFVQIANPPPGKSPYVNASRHVHRGEYIEVYSENISTHYAEVYWTMMPAIPLPKEFVDKYGNGPVAFTGYEADAVRVRPDGTEEHVPLYDAYNHHHNANHNNDVNNNDLPPFTPQEPHRDTPGASHLR